VLARRRAEGHGVAANRSPSKKPRRGSAAGSRDPVLLRFADGSLAVFGATRVVAGEEIVVTLVPDDPSAVARLEGLRAPFGRGQTVGLAYGSRALWTRLVDVRHEFASGVEVWQITLRPEHGHGRGVMDEMSTTGHSADDVAVLRARRILLDEPLPGRPSYLSHPNPWGGGGRDGMLEGLVRGFGSMPVARSPLPPLFAAWTGDQASFVAIARLVAVCWLTLTGVIETITRLDLALTKTKGQPALRVLFEGTRRKLYDNAPAPVVRVEGRCPLRSSAAA